MSLKQTGNSMLLVGALSGTVGLVAFLLLMVLGGWTFSPAFFVALFIAIVVAVFLLIAFHTKPSPPTGTDDQSATGSGGAASATGSGSAGSAGSPGVSASAAPQAEPVAVDKAEALGEAAVGPDATTTTDEGASAPSPTPAAASPQAAAVPPSGGGDKPKLLEAPRDEGPDDLKMIKGVGPKLEKVLHDLGVYHFDQVASWTDKEVAWVDENLEGFKGRVSRDNWVEQAKTLAAGGTTEFSGRVKKGDVY